MSGLFGFRQDREDTRFTSGVTPWIRKVFMHEFQLPHGHHKFEPDETGHCAAKYDLICGADSDENAPEHDVDTCLCGQPRNAYCHGRGKQ